MSGNDAFHREKTSEEMSSEAAKQPERFSRRVLRILARIVVVAAMTHYAGDYESAIQWWGEYREARREARLQALLDSMKDEEEDEEQDVVVAEDPGPRPSNGDSRIGSHMRAQIVGYRLSDPVDIDFRPGDPRPHVTGQSGLVQIVGPDGAALPEPFFDLERRAATEREQPGDSEGLGMSGALSLAFHPRFPHDPRLFLSLLIDSATYLYEYSVNPSEPDRVDYDSERLLLELSPAPQVNFAGHLEFGPDGRLYVGVPDARGPEPDGEDGEYESVPGQSESAAQEPGSVLGKLLALDVDRAEREPVIVARGLRNPWRFSFDRVTGDLYLPDNGESLAEELNVVPFDRVAAGGLDFGWDSYEADTCRLEECGGGGMGEPWMPLLSYSRNDGCNLTGGVVYRGRLFPELDGHYFFSDLCTGFVRSLRFTGAEFDAYSDWSDWVDATRDFAIVTAVALGPDGELYMALLPGILLRMIRVDDPAVPNRFVPPSSSPAPHVRGGAMRVGGG